MQFINYTPFPHLVFESRTHDDRVFGVIVLRGTFRFIPGQILRPSPTQERVSLHNVYRGDPFSSSLISEADLAPHKPNSDIHINAIAHSPGGVPRTEWPVRIRVGKNTKDLLVRGPHEWRYTRIGGWSLTAPRPCISVPIVYENAFGGCFQNEAQPLRNETNPAGTGWIPITAPREGTIRAPQIVAIDEPEHQPGGQYIPQGCGPIPPHWSLRLTKAGTFDEQWRLARAPRLPNDFDECFYNSAHPDLTYDGYLIGGEDIELFGVTPRVHPLRATLPKYGIYAVTRYTNGIRRAFELLLDTVFLDVASGDLSALTARLTWRARYPRPGGVTKLEVRLHDFSMRTQPRLDLERQAHG